MTTRRSSSSSSLGSRSPSRSFRRRSMRRPTVRLFPPLPVDVLYADQFFFLSSSERIGSPLIQNATRHKPVFVFASSSLVPGPSFVSPSTLASLAPAIFHVDQRKEKCDCRPWFCRERGLAWFQDAIFRLSVAGQLAHHGTHFGETHVSAMLVGIREGVRPNLMTARWPRPRCSSAIRVSSRHGPRPRPRVWFSSHTRSRRS